MKRIFIIVMVIFSLFCSGVSALNNIGYYKYNNTVIIHAENCNFDEAFLFTGEYINGKLINASRKKISVMQGKYESEKINMKDDIDYKFYIWDSSMTPLYHSLELNVSAENGSYDSGGDYTKPY